MNIFQTANDYITCTREQSSTTFELPTLSVMAEENGRRLSMVYRAHGPRLSPIMTLNHNICQFKHDFVIPMSI